MENTETKECVAFIQNVRRLADANSEINENVYQNSNKVSEYHQVTELLQNDEQKNITQVILHSDANLEQGNPSVSLKDVTESLKKTEIIINDSVNVPQFTEQLLTYIKPAEHKDVKPSKFIVKKSLINIKIHKNIACISTTSDSENIRDNNSSDPHNKTFNSHVVKTLPLDCYSTNESGTIVINNYKESDTIGRKTTLISSENEYKDIIQHKSFDSYSDINRINGYKMSPCSTKLQDETIPIFNTSVQMTPKAAAGLRQEIISESQRMMREKNIFLPYHKPKAHSLKEFLARRHSLAAAIPPATSASPSVAMKMSSEQLDIITKKLKERAKEVKRFYKSESETDTEDDTYFVPFTNDIYQSYEKSKESNKNPQILKNEFTSKHKDNNKSNPVVDIAKSANEDKTHDERNEINIAIPETNDTQQSLKNLQEEIGIHKTTVHSDKEGRKTTADATPGNVLIEMESEIIIDDYNKSLEVSPFFNTHTTQNSDFELDNIHTEQVVSTNNTPDAYKASKVVDNQGTSLAETGSASKQFVDSGLVKKIENFDNLENQAVTIDENCSGKPFSPPVKLKFEILKEKLPNVSPRLSGKPDEVIDLDSGLAKPKEVIELMERFAKHVMSKKHISKNTVQLSIVTVKSSGDIHNETVVLNVDNDKETEVKEEKPGAKLQRLREELQKQMNHRKSKIWRQKAANGLKGNADTNEDEEQNKYLDVLLDEEEAEMTDETDSEEEIENDGELFDKLLNKAKDHEAEEKTDLQKVRFEENVINGKEKIERSEDNESDSNDQDDKIFNVSDELPIEPLGIKSHGSRKEKKTLKRIITFNDNSDEEDLFNNSHKTMFNESLDSTFTADEDDIPPHQTREFLTPMSPAISQTKSISDFLTPISFITSIQNLTSATKINKYEPVISPSRMPHDQSPSKEDKLTILQKKLFTDSGTMDFQGLLNMKVTQSKVSTLNLGHDNNITSPLQESQQKDKDELPSTQDLIGICSGEFTGITQIESPEETRRITENGSQNSEFKNIDQNMVISQLLDEEELENFKKKFESPIVPITQRSLSWEVQEITNGGVIDSDEEDSGEFWLKKTRKMKKIHFSDDESSDEENDDSKEEIELDDKHEMDEETVVNIGYDSEENEINLNETENEKNLKLADFVDAEAELSESEWGSEDEDEKDLDKLEFEFGDTDKFDEKKVKEDLEKIHIRRMLDDDAREVKLLQEVLLEDGEMHGTGRQRQFKWKNIDINYHQSKERENSDEIYLDEEESEEQWRRKRHEREIFFTKKIRKSQDLDNENDELNNSQLLKIGQKVLQRSQSQNISQSNTTLEKTVITSESSINQTPFSLLKKRGSFLRRGDQVLQKVAEYTKSTTDISIDSSKTTKNFVFQSFSSSEVTIASGGMKKRKASDGTPKVLKKLRLNTNLSPAVKKTMPSKKSKKLLNL